MAKLRFELNIDEIIEGEVNVYNDHEVFKNPEATGKTFLFVDKLTGLIQAAFCKEAASESNKYARVEFYPLSQNAVIVDEEDKDIKNEALMAHIQDCCDKVCQTIQTYADLADSKHSVILQGLSPVLEKIEEGGAGSGISEKTLLEALKIVTNSREE